MLASFQGIGLMRSRTLGSLAFVIGVAVSSISPRAEAGTVPPFLPVQGHLVDKGGQPLEGTHSLTLMLYAQETDGMPVHFETHGAVAFHKGQFYVAYGTGGDADPEAGTGVTLDLTMFSTGTDYWLEVLVDETTKIEPRLRLGSVPYAGFAMNCSDSLTVGGKAAADLAGAGHPVSWNSVTGVPADIADGDGDRLRALSCAAGQVPMYADNNVWECKTLNLAPAAIVVFTVGDCPPGWSEFTAGQGRALVARPAGGTLGGTVGNTPLQDKEDRLHTHGASAPATTTSSGGAHTHALTGAANVSLAGAHTHTVQQSAAVMQGDTFATMVDPMNTPNHWHAADEEPAHTHPGTSVSSSLPQAAAHTHSFSFDTVQSAGVGTGQLMPYVQLRACIKN
jgi:hypothetical protein